MLFYLECQLFCFCLTLSLSHTYSHIRTLLQYLSHFLSLSLTPSLSFFLSGTAVSGVTACVCGSLAALVAETVCTPLDVVRTRIMVLGRNENKLENDKKSTATEKTITHTNNDKSPLIMFNKIIKEEGIAPLYKGAYVRVHYYLCLGPCILFFFFFIQSEVHFLFHSFSHSQFYFIYNFFNFFFP